MNIKLVVIHPRDNVAVVTKQADEGASLEGPDGLSLTALTNIPRNHKVAITRIENGRPVIKYGEVIGKANKDIQAGDWVHTHNLGSKEG